MPIFDTPGWIQHGGSGILSVDIDCSGQRLATGGADFRVRIWSMRPVVSEAAELDSSVPKQLAVLNESTAPVNSVRFAPSGVLLAAGTDDYDALIYELREGRGSSVFGSAEAPHVDNWRLRSRLRGHDMNVTDVAWSPDSHRLATASIDNRVKIWDAQSGHCIRTLEGHRGHVKGLAWDPFNFFLASQGDREAIVWRLEDGVPVARISEPFAGAPIASFALRPSWSPDGQTLALANGYESGSHTVPILRRNAWGSGEDRGIRFAGHKMGVTVVRYNPHLYFAPPRRRAAAADGEGGGGGGEEEEDAAGGVAAVGSFDKTFSLWHPLVSTPLLVGHNFLKRLIDDIAWSPDGRMMVVAGYDGNVVTVLFEEGELGRRVPEEEVKALHAQLYGDPKLRNQKSALTAAPELLQLEARAQADVQREERLSSRMGSGATGLPGAGQGGSLSMHSLLGAAAPSVANGLMAAAAVTTASGLQLPLPLATTTSGLRAPSPAKGPAGGAAGGGLASGGPSGPSGREPDQPAAKRTAFTAPAPSGLAGAGAGPAGAGRPGLSGMGSAGGGAAAAAPGAPPGAGAAVAANSVVVVPYDPIRQFLSLLIHVPTNPGEPQACMELQALNSGRDARGRPTAELICLTGPSREWSDSVQGHVVCMAGSNKVAAVSTTNGDLLVYSSAGRRLFPPIRLGCPASYMSMAKGGTVLLAVLSNGQARMWDLAGGESLLESSVAPLLGPGPGGAVAAVRITANGCPVVILGNAHAYVHHWGMKCWMRVADDAFPASAYTSSIASTTTGELGKMQAAAAQRRNPRDVIATTAAQAAGPADAARSDQALLEHNLAAAAVLQSPNEWRLWLITYVRRLARDGDEPRLREIVTELMGPLRWSPATHPGAATGAAAAAGRSSGGGGGGVSEPPLSYSLQGRWQPSILGFDKRRLLREVVLQEVSKNRAQQQLVAEVLELLKQVEGAAREQPARAVGSGTGGSGSAGPPEGGGAPQQAWAGAQPALQPQPMALG